MNYKSGILVWCLVFVAFNTTAESTDHLSLDNNIVTEKGQPIILGDKIVNPYSVSDDNIDETHLYIKFKPENNEELGLLSTSSDINLFPYPLDRTITQGGDHYKDDSLVDGQLPYQYAVVPALQRLPGVPYEILDRLVLPSTDAYKRSFAADDKSSEISTRWWWEKPKLKYGGSVKVWDNYTSKYIPIVGLKITATSLFRSTNIVTDKNGKFYIPSNYWPVVYKYTWTDPKFDISRSILGGLGVSTGPVYGISSSLGWPWEERIGASSILNPAYYHHAILPANAWRAAKHYFYGNTLNTVRPTKTPAGKKIEIGIDHFLGRFDSDFGFTYYIPTNKARVNLNYTDFFWTGKSSQWMYYVTLHELAHVVHFDELLKLYKHEDECGGNCVNPKVREGWAVGVATALTRLTYPDFVSSKEDPFNAPYTGIITDMMDPAVDDSYDKVEGYTLKQIETTIRHLGIGESNDLYALIQSLKDRYDNPTEVFLDELVDHWGN